MVQTKHATTDADGFAAQEAQLRPREAPGQVQRRAAPVQRSVGAVARDLLYGITHPGEVIEGNRRRDEQNEMAELADKLSAIKQTLDAIAEGAESGGPRIEGLSRRLTQIQRGLQALEYAAAISDALEIAGRWDDVQTAWTQHRANPTAASARALSREMGGVIAPLGRVLGLLPPPVGTWASLLAEANGAWFEANVANILHTERRWRQICRDPAMADVPQCATP